MQGARTTAEIFDKTTPALKITHDKLSEISADAWKNVPQYLNTKHADKIQIKQDPASGVFNFDDPFQQRTVGRPSDSTVMQRPSDCLNKRTADPAPKANESADLRRRNNKEQFGLELKQRLSDLPKEQLRYVLEFVDEKYNLPDLEIFGFLSAVK